jgi:L-threonylcarbamoyladenylate synthase
MRFYLLLEILSCIPLYNALHKLDQLHLDVIIAERFPDHGLGRTINDRLERATTK